MDSSRERDFLPRTLSYESLFSLGQESLTPEPALEDGHDDLEKDYLKSRTFLDSSWPCCGVSPPQSKYKEAYKSSDFHPSVGSDAHSIKSQILQEQYWACAIPKCLPPRPDRSSPNWDPNKEYQDLLDYSYPLNPKYCLGKDNQTDGLFHDSGVDVGSYTLSSESKLSSSGSPYGEDHKPKPGSTFSHTSILKSPYAFSTPLCKRTGYRNVSESSHLTSCDGEASAYTGKADLAKESTNSSYFPRYNLCDNVTPTLGSRLLGSNRFKSSTSILPSQGDLDTDEDYLSLPPSLKELETLASQLKDLSLTVEQPKSYLKVNAYERQRCSSGTGSITEGGLKDLSYGSRLSAYGKYKDINGFSAVRDMLDGGDSSFLGMTEHSSLKKLRENYSLVQRIQTFCLMLDKLIRWLYSVAEITDNWIAPKPNPESIQRALGLYLKLKKEVAEQRSLTDAIIMDGESLLQCMAVNSKVLKDTLAFISKQSGELERHTERLYASVLEAMDTISDRGLGRSGNPKHPVSLEMESI